MKLTYFYSSEIESSKVLKNKICSMPICQEFDICLVDDNSEHFTQLDFLIACHRDDIVIVDCTIPDEKQLKTVYPILVLQVNMLDHVLVVSNTMLPLNITPQRQGYDSPRLKSNFTTGKQLKWVEQQLDDLYHLISTGKHYHRILLKNYFDLENARPQMEQMWIESEKFKKKQEDGKKKVLISYRNSHYEEVLAYKAEYENKHPDEIVRVVEPGVLCSGKELLTPLRKWMLVFMLEEKIHDIDELIIYRTHDYTESWWTCAELVMVAYNNYSRTESEKIRVKYYDAINKADLEKDAIDWLLPIKIEIEQKNVIARLAANTHPDNIGQDSFNENKDRIRLLCKKYNDSNIFIKIYLKWKIKSYIKITVPSSLSKKECKETIDHIFSLITNPLELEKYLSDDVFSEKFYNQVCYQVVSPTPAFEKKGEKYFINVKEFLETPMKEIQKPGHCNSCRYLWFPTRMGHPAQKGDNGLGLFRIPTYE